MFRYGFGKSRKTRFSFVLKLVGYIDLLQFIYVRVAASNLGAKNPILKISQATYIVQENAAMMIQIHILKMVKWIHVKTAEKNFIK